MNFLLINNFDLKKIFLNENETCLIVNLNLSFHLKQNVRQIQSINFCKDITCNTI